MQNHSFHPSGVYFQGKVNKIISVVYFDTGKNYSVINRKLVNENEIVSDKSGTFYNGTIEISFGEYSFEIFQPRVGDLNRPLDSEFPIGIDVGSDLLRHFLITIDRTDNNNVLILH